MRREQGQFRIVYLLSTKVLGAELAEELRMIDVTGSKTLTVVLAIVLLGVFICLARTSRRDASGAEMPHVDATTHAHEAARTADEVNLHPAGKRASWPYAPATRLNNDPQSAGVVNEALGEMEALDEADRAAGEDWRSQRGDARRRDGWTDG